MDNIVVLGGGGREHSLALKLAQSEEVQHVFVAPGNGGTANSGKISNVDLNIKNFDEVSGWCTENNITMVVVGPEDPLAAGMADHLSQKGISCFGPSAKAAQIEASKVFAKNFMVRHNIPTARFQSFTNAESACEHINSADYKALVVKASGLAAGKGVIVAETKEEACHAVRSMLQDKIFGVAGETVIVEELLDGDEVSCLAFSDGSTVALMPPAQDYKRLMNADKGPNTGGMGSICPYPKLTERDLFDIKSSIIQKTIDGLQSEGVRYIGVLYAGVMLTKIGPKVLEFNCRFGDPETQSILPLLKSDLNVVCKACINGTLASNLPQFDTESCVLSVVMVSGGYPGSYKKRKPISGLDEVSKLGLTVIHAGTSIHDSQIVTSGGRVLAIVAKDTDFREAIKNAQKGAALVSFEEAFYRKDIGLKILDSALHIVSSKESLTYKDAGVNIASGHTLVEAIKPLAKMTIRPGCKNGIGSFGALFNLEEAGYKNPVLVSSTDGVGTKLKVAQVADNHRTIGIDLVAMCVNDILAHGAEPLFFLDYFSCGKLYVSLAREVVAGISEGCQMAGCALVGGETAEMPGMYQNSDYDVAGFTVGAVESDQTLPRIADIKPGDVVIGLASSGIHSNGFSLVRKVIEKNGLKYDMPSPFKAGKTIGDELLTPTKIYVKSVLPLMKAGQVKAFAHITGGGLMENIPRILPEDVSACLDASSWDVPQVFSWLYKKGNVPECDMIQTFNCGIGSVLIVDNCDVPQMISSLETAGEKAYHIGSLIPRSGKKQVEIQNLQSALDKDGTLRPAFRRRKRVAILISGSGTNLQALIDYTKNPLNKSAAEITLVISNKPGVQGLKRAEMAGIKTKVINHKKYKDRVEFDAAIHSILVAAEIDLVCLAGFMRVLTGGFVQKWNGRMLNIHPSLLPLFKGANPHKLVLEARVRISGCSVHFVAEEIDSGAILVQESVPVYPGDTEVMLSERIKKAEHMAFPKALELVASEEAVLQEDGKILWRM